MKKRLFISVVLALILTVLGSAPVLAAKPKDFSASGIISVITPGDVVQAGKSDRWVVVEREITGTLSGDINDAFTLTYKANIESLETQAGNLHGKLATGDGEYVIQMNGKIEPLGDAGWYDEEEEIPLYKITITGHWTVIEGVRGQGDFSAWAIFVPTPEGHVYFITASAFDLTGKWNSD